MRAKDALATVIAGDITAEPPLIPTYRKFMTYQQTHLRMNFSDTQIAGAANSFAKSGIVRIVDLYDAEVEWSRAVSNGEKSWDLRPDLIAAMDDGKKMA